MDQNTVRTHSLGQIVRSAPGMAATERQGRLDGTSLTIRPAEVDIDEKIQAEQMARSAGLLISREPKAISQFRISTQASSPDLGLAQARQLEKAFSSSKKIAQTAQELLRNMLEGRPLPKSGSSPAEVADRFASLTRLREALAGDDDTFVALMSPLPNNASDVDSIAKKLEDARNNEQEFDELLADIRGSANEEEMAALMETTRFDTQKLKSALRKAQSLPLLDNSAKQELAEKVQDEIAELLRRDESHVRAMNAVLEKAGEGPAREAVLSYDELVHSGWSSFTGMLEILISRHPPKELSHNIMPLMEQTLAHELGRESEQRSVDKPKLEALMSWLQCFRIAKGLFPSLERLTTTMGRMYGVS